MSDHKTYDVIITGAGPAGLFCAINCCRIKSLRVLILEKMHAAGRKLLLSGSGSCNITHAGKIKDFESMYGNNGRFLRYALSGFTNIDMISFLNSNGIKTIEAENGKIFPESMKSREILELLLRKMEDSGVEIQYKHAVQEITCNEGLFRVRASGEFFTSACCVITTGGASYPGTGSSGDGYSLAESFGHTIKEITPALTPVTIAENMGALTPAAKKFPELSGISIKNALISLYRNTRKLTTYQGDLLFTHNGLSGPVILDMSRFIMPGDTLTVSFIQDRPENFEEEFIVNSRNQGKRSIKNLLHSQKISERIIELILDMASISHNKKASEISREERKKLSSLITAFPFKVAAKGGFDVAMATHGGISLEEINMRTMESKIVPGLFFAGEVMDIDGNTGGYNLQAAFSTGKLAGDEISKRI